MEISVIIPTYKPLDYIWECLDSLKKQTLNKSKFEIILILNGCNEPYQTVIKTYISQNLKNHNILFIQTDQPGVSNARNIGLEKSQGDYIMFLDDDDYLSSSCLEGLLKKVSDKTIALCNMRAFRDEDRSFIKYKKEDIFKKNEGKISSVNRVCEYFAGPCAKLISKSIIQEKRFDPQFKNGEDSLFMFLISNQIKDVAFTSIHDTYYRRFRENSAYTSPKTRKQVISNRLKLIKCYLKIFFKAPFQYNFIFLMTRIGASLKTIIYNII